MTDSVLVWIIYISIAAIIGSVVGFAVCAVLSAAKRFDDQIDQNPLEPQSKPTRLLTVGCTVKWNGELFEIKKMTVGEDNQTDAIIKNDRAMLRVPIDDLEAEK